MQCVEVCCQGRVATWSQLTIGQSCTALNAVVEQTHTEFEVEGINADSMRGVFNELGESVGDIAMLAQNLSLSLSALLVQNIEQVIETASSHKESQKAMEKTRDAYESLQNKQLSKKSPLSQSDVRALHAQFTKAELARFEHVNVLNDLVLKAQQPAAEQMCAAVCAMSTFFHAGYDSIDTHRSVCACVRACVCFR